MKFGTFIDAQGNFFDTVHFPPSLTRYPLYGAGIYLIRGRVVLDFSCPCCRSGPDRTAASKIRSPKYIDCYRLREIIGKNTRILAYVFINKFQSCRS